MSAYTEKVMRKLFYFLGDLLAGLLQAIAGGILLLDRALYARPIRASKRTLPGLSRPMSALVAFVPLFVLPYLTLSKAGKLVLVEGQPVGMIDSEARLAAVVADIERSASSLSDTAYTLPFTVDLRTTRGVEDAFLDDGQLRQQLIDASGELDMLAVISIEGERVGVCRNAQDAQVLLERVQHEYTTNADSRVRFLQAVRVDNVVAERSQAQDLGTLYSALLPRLDVTSMRAVTYTEDIPYHTVTRENAALEQGNRQTVQQGQSGTARVMAEIVTIDGMEQSRTVLERAVLRDAVDEIVEVGTKNVGIGTGTLAAPMNSYTFTSSFRWRWGRMHTGCDLAAPEGTPVYAADNGRVIVSEDSGNGYGRYLIIDHRNGFKTLYAHNSVLLVSTGQVVAKGEKIALSGNTGNSTGPHLHFEVMVDDEKIDPMLYVAL